MECQTILVVDEDELTLRLLEHGFNRHFQVLSVPEGQRAIELAKKNAIDLAIVARCLPHMDGLEVLRRLRKVAPEVPVIFVATAPTKAFIIDAFRAGARDFIEKPIDERLLTESVTRILDLVETEQASEPDNGKETSFGKRKLLVFKNLFRRPKRRKSKRWQLQINSERVRKVTARSIPAEIERKALHSFSLGDRAAQLAGKSPPTLQVYFLGKFRAVLNGHDIGQWPSRKGKSLFAYLAFNHKRRIYRDILMDKFWPGSSPDSARNCLNVALHGLRQVFKEIDSQNEYLFFRDDCYYLNPEIEIWLDTQEFLHHWRVAQSTEREQKIEAAIGEYERAAAAYKGDFIEQEIYESWMTLNRENLKEIYLVILDRLSTYYGLDGKPATAIKLCETMLEKDNCREDVHRRMMRCYYKLGQRDKAIKQFQKCAEILKAELEIGPTRATLDVLKKIKEDSLDQK
ncbi:MAG: response regulator [bacterium]